MVIWIILILLMFVLSWREIQILIDRGSYTGTSRLPLWYIDWKSKWKNFDSFHALNGVALILILEMIDLPRYKFELFWNIDWCFQIWVAAYWIVLMQIRNLFMYLIYKKG